MVTRLVALLCCSAMAFGCDRNNRPDAPAAGDGQVAVENIDTPPAVSSEDQRYAGVYRPLDGRWRGTFRIYVDTRGQVDGPARPTDLDPSDWREPPYQLNSTLEVEQHYESESPYFQRVEIVDTYPDGRVVRSRGVNKVQDGQMWCVVDKPDDLVIHEGTLEGDHTIIWSRDRESPKAIEWFEETVSDETYTIVGWGYYGSDDPTKAPRMYFHAEYERVE
jgi:hypothetical protein